MARTACRLALNHPPSRLWLEAARARVREVWKQHPEITAGKLIAMPGFKHLLGIQRAWQLVKECRRDAAKRSPMHKRVGWYLDYRTAARIRVASTWKRHPEITGKQAVELLGLERTIGVKWVQKVMHECWRASAKHSRQQQRIGRKVYGGTRR